MLVSMKSPSTLPPGVTPTPMAIKLDAMALARGWTQVTAEQRLQDYLARTVSLEKVNNVGENDKS